MTAFISDCRALSDSFGAPDSASILEGLFAGPKDSCLLKESTEAKILVVFKIHPISCSGCFSLLVHVVMQHNCVSVIIITETT